MYREYPRVCELRPILDPGAGPDGDDHAHMAEPVIGRQGDHRRDEAVAATLLRLIQSVDEDADAATGRPQARQRPHDAELELAEAIVIGQLRAYRLLCRTEFVAEPLAQLRLQLADHSLDGAGDVEEDRRGDVFRGERSQSGGQARTDEERDNRRFAGSGRADQSLQPVACGLDHRDEGFLNRRGRRHSVDQLIDQTCRRASDHGIAQPCPVRNQPQAEIAAANLGAVERQMPWRLPFARDTEFGREIGTQQVRAAVIQSAPECSQQRASEAPVVGVAVVGGDEQFHSARGLLQNSDPPATRSERSGSGLARVDEDDQPVQ
ncbi:hypothetical protein IU470_26860 [Nocardia abscessus]|uniref:Uncharacterized protein n=1 Tax=Nocardia abscessus TaxID=120957 RepID=A0ABS0CEJ6_9NOCA|nr:hypothetical protein [Nocardia abscessus]MBF6228711.1 hypothetical protein [Nocardia abscessus]